MAPPRWRLTGSTCRALLKGMSLSFMLRPVRRRPVPRVGIVRSKTCQNGLVVRGFAVHVFHGGLGLLQPLMGLGPLLENNGVPRSQVFLRSLQQTQTAISASRKRRNW